MVAVEEVLLTYSLGYSSRTAMQLGKPCKEQQGCSKTTSGTARWSATLSHPGTPGGSVWMAGFEEASLGSLELEQGPIRARADALVSLHLH